MNEYRKLMETLDQIAEGDDTTADDVKRNHPEIYKVFEKGVGFQSAGSARVSTYDLGATHTVNMTVKPSAGLRNVMLALDEAGIPYTLQNETIRGEGNGFTFTVSNTGPAGNSSQVWSFKIQNELEEFNETVDEYGYEMDPIEFIKQNHLYFEGGKNSDAKFWEILDPTIPNVHLVFYYLPKTSKFGASIVYLDDQDFEELDNPYEMAQQYGPYDLQDFLSQNQITEENESLEDLKAEYQRLQHSDAIGTAQKLRILSQKIKNHPDNMQQEPDYSYEHKRWRDEDREMRQGAKDAADIIRKVMR